MKCLATLVCRLKQNPPKKQPAVFASHVLDLDTQADTVGSGRVSVLIGTVYVDAPLKPSILDVVATENWAVPPPPRVKYADARADKVLLEDESGRLEMVGSCLAGAMLVSGVVMAVLGAPNNEGHFEVQDTCFAECTVEPVLERPLSRAGVGLDSSMSFEMQLMLDFICEGAFGEAHIMPEGRIVRVILAGNSLSRRTPLKTNYAAGSMGRSTTAEMYAPTSLKQLDTFLSQICACVDVDIMPGASDPTNFALPQQPMLSGLFPISRGFSSFHSTTNPYSASIDGKRFLGGSGQTLDDIFKFVESEDRLTMAENTLRWAHLAPTAPDTLACYPYQDADPFVIEYHPDVYFFGNQPQFATRMFTGVDGKKSRIVLVPSFAEAKTIALVNLRTLDCRKVSFK
ncbi:DNA polymerase delta subunit 2 [Entophlyctis luteolus]|nr:DNA polymerase delta subunit 2 [Entophlyctis luteolus]